MVARFLIFIILFALVFAFIGKWIYIYLQKLWNKDKNNFVDEIEETKFSNLKCRSITSHNMIGNKPNSICKWCGKTLSKIKEEEKKKELINKGN